MKFISSSCYSSFLIICNYFVVKLQWDMHPRSINQDSYLKSSVHQIAKLHFGIICTCGQKSLVDISQTCSLCSPPNGPVLGPENKSKHVKSQNNHMIDLFKMITIQWLQIFRFLLAVTLKPFQLSLEDLNFFRWSRSWILFWIQMDWKWYHHLSSLSNLLGCNIYCSILSLHQLWTQSRINWFDII